MKKLRLFITFFIITLFLFSCHDDEIVVDPKTAADDCITMKSATNGDIIPGQYIVALNDETNVSSRITKVNNILERHHLTSDKVLKHIEGRYATYVMHLSEKQVQSLQQDTSVQAVEPDRIISICSCFTVVNAKTITWNVNKVGYGDGSGKTAWVLDTGIDYDHPDLTVDVNRSHSFIDGITTADDDNGHGTHVAGVIGAKNNNFGIFGVASGATLISLKILDENGDGKLSSALSALAYVKANAKAGDAVNISMGLEEVSPILENTIKDIASRGIYFSIASGNDGGTANQYSPAHANGANIYTVSAVDSLGRFASFSNYGNDVVDYAAPGVTILSSYKGGKYAIMSGTSMAAPHVAGLLLINNGKINSDGYAKNDPDGTPDPLAHQ